MLNKLAALASGTGDEPDYASHFSIPLDASPNNRDLVQELSERLRDLCETHNWVVVDFAYPRGAGLYSRAEWLLASAILKAVDKTTNANLVIVVDSLPTPSERLNVAIEEIGDIRLQFVDVEGRWRGHLAGDGDRMSAVLAAVNDQANAIDEFAKRFVRWRGVFRRRGALEDRYFNYQYTLKGTIGTEELSELLISYVEARRPQAVFYSDPADPGWLQPSVHEATYLEDLPCASLKDLAAWLDDRLEDAWSRDAVERAVEAAAQSGVYLLALPAYKDGLSLGEAESLFRRAGLPSPLVLAVLMDQDTAETGATIESSDHWFKTVRFERGSDQIDVDHFITCPVVTLAQDSWQVAAAGVLDEIREMSMDISEPTKVGMWSLIDHYPTGTEWPLPNGRPPYGFYPLMADLDPYDARWILHVLVERLCSHLDCDPRSLLFVMPSEENASRRLHSEALQFEGLSVVGLERGQIEGAKPVQPEDLDTIRRFRQLRVVLLDEAVVRGTTVRKLQAIVTAERGRKPDATVALLQVGDDFTADISLFKWSPFTFAEAK